MPLKCEYLFTKGCLNNSFPLTTGDVPYELPGVPAVPRDEPAVPVLLLRAAGVVLVQRAVPGAGAAPHPPPPPTPTTCLRPPRPPSTTSTAAASW